MPQVYMIRYWAAGKQLTDEQRIGQLTGLLVRLAFTATCISPSGLVGCCRGVLGITSLSAHFSSSNSRTDMVRQ